jgi:hypothetical protein
MRIAQHSKVRVAEYEDPTARSRSSSPARSAPPAPGGRNRICETTSVRVYDL